MPDLAVGDIIQTRVEWELYGQRDLTVWHWRVNDVNPDQDMFEYLADGLNAWLADPAGGLFTVLAELSSDVVLKAIVSQVVWPIRFRAVRTPVEEVGGSAFVAGTNNVALSIGFGGDLAGRGRAGRSQILGIPQKWQISGKWDVGVITSIADALESIRVGPQTPPGFTVQLNPVLFRRQDHTHQNVTTIHAYDTIRTMRRRTWGVGQ